MKVGDHVQVMRIGDTGRFCTSRAYSELIGKHGTVERVWPMGPYRITVLVSNLLFNFDESELEIVEDDDGKDKETRD